ncbi:hypothetical protein [Brevibacillus daliensis]|uniref:hypothetical protein n=1 Tax=Brevibacillus daliensis TaxID=2892995 RepID=UPI001E5EF277|nr:hypothetical protein [Brevibacillus daliensis]
MTVDPDRVLEPSELLIRNEMGLFDPFVEDDTYTDAYLASLGWYSWPGVFY